MVYIDTPKGGWSHLVASSIEELHEFMRNSGVKKRFENKRGKNQPHYDIRGEEYQIVINKGAIPITRKELLLFLIKTYT